MKNLYIDMIKDTFHKFWHVISIASNKTLSPSQWMSFIFLYFSLQNSHSFIYNTQKQC